MPLSGWGRPTGPTLVAEGDSWFDFPVGADLIDQLVNRHNYNIKKFATAGDTLENMVYGTDLRDVHRRRDPQIIEVLEAVALHKPPVFLFSGGGNDVAGDEFGTYLNHADAGAGQGLIREDFADFMINTVFRQAYHDLIDKVRARSPKTVIIAHGYARPVPTGQGVDVLFWTFAGPWLKPALMRKNITSKQEQVRIAHSLLDMYNNMLQSVQDDRPTEFRYVDFRPLVRDADWRDELHLHNSAWAACAAKLDQEIKRVIAS
jgi:hypothetical protein